MQRDLVFEGALGLMLSSVLLYMTIVEIPFYPQEIQVQKVVIGAMVGCVLLIIIGAFYRGR